MIAVARNAVFAFGMLYAGVAGAGDIAEPKGVVELFTSQGCASCPPADAALKKLVEQGDVIALSYHVDYWNYLGWTDTLSSKENTERQYNYAHAFGRSGVYTPQAVVNGRDHLIGTDVAAINDKMDGMRGNGQGLTVPVKASLNGEEIEINIGPGAGKADIVLAYFTKKEKVDVDKGENTGKQMEYWHSVYDVQTVGMWDGKDVKITVPARSMGKSKKDGCAILLQTSKPGGEPAAIIGATVLMAGRKRD